MTPLITDLAQFPCSQVSKCTYFDPKRKTSGFQHDTVLQNMVKLDGQGMEQHFTMGIPFNVITGPVQLLYDSLLLLYSGNFIKSFCHIQLGPRHYGVRNAGIIALLVDPEVNGLFQ